MNEFYHEFTVGFNWWFVVGPLMAVAMLLLGTTRYILDPYSKRIRRRGSGFDRLVKLAAAVFDLILMAMICRESVVGLIQMMVNHIDGDPIWAIIMLPVALMAAAVGIYCLFYLLARVGEWTKHGYLIDLRHDLLEEEKERAKRKPRRQMPIITIEPEIEKVEAEIVEEEEWLDEGYDDSGWGYGPAFGQAFAGYGYNYAGYSQQVTY